MANQRLFPEQHKNEPDEREPRERFNDIASKVFSTPKSDIDEREKKWQEHRSRRARLKSS